MRTIEHIECQMEHCDGSATMAVDLRPMVRVAVCTRCAELAQRKTKIGKKLKLDPVKLETLPRPIPVCEDCAKALPVGICLVSRHSVCNDCCGCDPKDPLPPETFVQVLS